MMKAREFVFVPMGQDAPADSIACDGLVDGAALDLSHWPKNKTPSELKADTSVEIALTYVRSLSSAEHARGPRRVVNNHFDSDGVLSVFILLSPEIALAFEPLIVAAAEAGDFGEWPADDRGLWLDFALKRLVALKPESSAYPLAIAALPELLRTLESREDLWGKSFSFLLEAERRAKEGDVSVSSIGTIAIFHHHPGVAEMPGPVFARLLPPHTRRVLVAFEQADGLFRYRYEMPSWAWAETVRRPALQLPSRNALSLGFGPGWALKGGELGMTGLLRTTEPIRETPSEIAAALLSRERFVD